MRKLGDLAVCAEIFPTLACATRLPVYFKSPVQIVPASGSGPASYPCLRGRLKFHTRPIQTRSRILILTVRRRLAATNTRPISIPLFHGRRAVHPGSRVGLHRLETPLRSSFAQAASLFLVAPVCTYVIEYASSRLSASFTTNSSIPPRPALPPAAPLPHGPLDPGWKSR